MFTQQPRDVHIGELALFLDDKQVFVLIAISDDRERRFKLLYVDSKGAMIDYAILYDVWLIERPDTIY